MNEGLKNYLVSIRKKLKFRDTVLELLTYLFDRRIVEVNFEHLESLDLSLKLKLYDIVIVKDKTKTKYAYVKEMLDLGYVFEVISDFDEKVRNAPANVIDEISIKTGDIDNYTGPAITTTVGRFFLNQVVLVDIFGDAVPYVNETVMPADINKRLVDKFTDRTFKVELFHKYVDRVFFMEQFSDICVPTETERSMTTDPNLAKKKKELLEKYAGQFDDPVVISKFEQELIEMDKAYIKGDPAERYFKPSEGKSYGMHRKKMLLTVGGIDSFSEKGGTSFIANSLAEGWDINKIDLIANEIRKGAYSRGQETQKGGEQAKLLLRVFQDLLITEDDCKSKVGYPVQVEKELIKDYLGRHMFTPKGLEMLDKESLASLTGKTIEIRSPMTCKTNGGLCKICVGNELAKLDHDSVVAMVLSISAMLLKMFLKQMHGTAITTLTVDDLSEFIHEVE